MGSTSHKQYSALEEQQKIAVPYVPPPPPDSNSFKRFRSPLINGAVAAFIILLFGFMAYNFLGHQLTQTASESTVNATPPSPTISPTTDPTPSPLLSPTSTPSMPTRHGY